MDALLIVILTSFIAAGAWLTRFAIKEYPVFKKLKIPSSIFKHGASVVFMIWLWHFAASYVYSRMLPLVQPDKIEQINKSITLMVDKGFVYYFTGCWLFLWFLSIFIDELAKKINKIRNEENGKSSGINNK